MVGKNTLYVKQMVVEAAGQSSAKNVEPYLTRDVQD